MHVSSNAGILTLRFSALESRLLQNIIGEIVLNYRTKPEALPPKAVSAWYSTRGCEAAGMSAEESREWVESLHQYKSANVQNLLKWRRTLDVPKAGQREFKLKVEEAPILLTALNDHRLFLAAQHDIGQAEMDMRSLAEWSKMEPARQTAAALIDFLACILEQLLRFLPGNPAGWIESMEG